MSNKNDDLLDLGTEARLAVQLAKAGALDNSLGFLTRRIRNDFGTCQDGLDLVIAELRSQTPQCFAEEKVDPLRTKKLVEAMPTGHAEMLDGIAAYFRQRSEAKALMAKSH